MSTIIIDISSGNVQVIVSEKVSETKEKPEQIFELPRLEVHEPAEPVEHQPISEDDLEELHNRLRLGKQGG